MLAVLAFLLGLALAGYGAARWFREREAVVLAEIAQHYERRQQLMLAAYAELDRVENLKALLDLRLAEARAELDAALAAKAQAEQMLERRQAALATADVQLDRMRRAAASDRRSPQPSAPARMHGEQATHRREVEGAH
jgi:multidrug efflux pump subunit AcrA (membrane-fusion protein)